MQVTIGILLQFKPFKMIYYFFSNTKKHDVPKKCGKMVVGTKRM